MTYSRKQLIAMTMYGEARGQSLNGQILVGFTLMNRWKHPNPRRYGKTLHDICWKREQFDCWKKGNVNYKKMHKAMQTLIDMGVSKRMEQCMYLSSGVLTGHILDISKGANHFYATKTKKPFWAKGHTPCVIEGDHAFYKLP
ncbi:MAG: cell wall hydrolase [bacterium]|nr:cell wall hydrolase [bacterium]